MFHNRPLPTTVSVGDTISRRESSLDGPVYTAATFPAIFWSCRKYLVQTGLKRECDDNRNKTQVRAKTVRGGCSGVAPKESHATASLFSNVAYLNFSVYFWHNYPEIIYDLPSKQQSAVTNKSSWTTHTSALNNLHQSKNVICGHFYYWISE